MKIFHRALASLLAMSMTVSLTSTVLATEPKTTQESDPFVVTCIGDSIANGCSMFRDTDIEENYAVLSTENYNTCFTGANMALMGAYDNFIEEDIRDKLTAEEAMSGDYDAIIQAFEKRMLSSFPIQVALALNGYDTDSFDSEADLKSALLNATDYRCLTYSGMSSIDFRSRLQTDYVVPDGATGMLDMVKLFKKADTSVIDATMDHEDVINGITDSDLLIYALGGNDIFASAIPAFRSLMVNTGEDVEISEVVTTLAKSLLCNLAAYQENTEYILQTYLEKNPDASVCLVGMYDFLLDNDITDLLDPDADNGLKSLLLYSNPNSSMGMLYGSLAEPINALDNDLAKAICNVLEGAISVLNKFMLSLADKYENTYFVDINGAATRDEVTEAGYTAVSGDGLHPSVSGHAYIARKILAALPDDLSSTPDRSITVDISAVPGTVTGVLVNNKPVTGYTVSSDGYMLTIPYEKTDAVTVTVFTNGETAGINTWQCSWNRTDGYRTYTLYKISSVEKMTTLVLNRLRSNMTKVFAKLKSLVKAG